MANSIKYYNQLVNELCAETGIGKTSIQKIISECNSNKTISSRNLKKKKNRTNIVDKNAI